MRQAYPNELIHGGSKGMKWGYTKGRRNGKRTAIVLPSALVNDKTVNTVASDVQGIYEYSQRDKSQSPSVDASTVNTGSRKEVNILDFIAKWSSASLSELADYVPTLGKIKSFIDALDAPIYDKEHGWFPGFKKGGSK